MLVPPAGRRLSFVLTFSVITMGLLSNLKLKKASITDRTQVFLNSASGGSTSSSTAGTGSSSTGGGDQGKGGSGWTSVNPRDEFVHVHKGQLALAGHSFRFAGLNAPELLDGNVNGPFEIEHTFQTLSMQGSFARAVTRTYTLQVSTRDSLLFRPNNRASNRETRLFWAVLSSRGTLLTAHHRSLVCLQINSKNIGRGHIKSWHREWNDWEWDEGRLREIDRVLVEARKHGVKLIIPIINQDTGEDSNWVGCYADLIRMRKSLSSYEESTKVDWWTDDEMIESHLIIDKLLNRVNHINGIRIGDDATILAFETASYPIEVLQSSDIDILSYHYYGSGDSYRVKKDCEYVVGKHGKAFVAGEVGFFGEPSMYDSFLNDLHKYGGSGALVWSLRPASASGGYKTHGEGNGNWAMHIPGWATCSHPEFDPRERQIISILRHHSYKLNHQKTPSQHPIPPAPSKVWLDPQSHGRRHILWTSAPWAHSYELILRDLSTGHEYGRRQVWDCTKEGESHVDLSMELGTAPRDQLGVWLRGISLDRTAGPESEMLRLDS
ncbi:BQ2448_2007 [Microbotryum intermedium]|uniref:BQ2448_2007 protein n=1 Tax=Microbotryum intermedium TaxID=269621 RepID=A0A238F758_9BASI|nr:BQ2448_2007 [Microbotryum intermedium]